MSNYFIRKLRYSIHYYIDGIFVRPKGFVQLIVILYYENKTQKRYLSEFALINNKTEQGYKELFKSLFNYISIENTKPLSLKSYTTDFEAGLINALKSALPNANPIGCFYHI